MPKFLVYRHYETVIEALNDEDAIDFAADLSVAEFDLVLSGVEVSD